MGKKLKKDFKERHKASLEREMFHSKTDTIPEESTVSYEDFEAQAAEHCANLVFQVVQSL